MADNTSGINALQKSGESDQFYTATKVIQDADGNTVKAEIILYSDATKSKSTTIAEMSGTDSVPQFIEGSSDIINNIENRNLILKVYRSQVENAVKGLEIDDAQKKSILDKLNNTNNASGS